MYIIRKKFKFECAHKLESSYSTCCQHIHGHSYIVEVKVQSSYLNSDGMVIDFGLLKTIIEPLIKIWDHQIILQNTNENREYDKNAVLVSFNPTAENMARYLYSHISSSLFSMPEKSIKDQEISLKSVRVHETDTGWAEYKSDAYNC